VNSEDRSLHHADKEIAVRFDSVSFSYGDVRVLENASFHIHRGEFAALVGPNGSGKTTVLKLLFGLETPCSGRIELFSAAVFGAACADAARRRRQSNLAYVSQQQPADRLFPITVRDIVRMGLLRPYKRYSRGNDAVAGAMEMTGIADLASRQYRALSGGQKRRTLVARALAAKPELLVLDEPTANMDSESEARLYETLGSYKGKTTILIVTHDTGFVTVLTDKVFCLGDGSCTVVQHRLDRGVSASDTRAHHGDSAAQYGEARVLHGENIPDDDCCRQ
jgi:zinc transport system ATP-binding protein